jgi:hypothetical protein
MSRNCLFAMVKISNGVVIICVCIIRDIVVCKGGGLCPAEDVTKALWSTHCDPQIIEAIIAFRFVLLSIY